MDSEYINVPRNWLAEQINLHDRIAESEIYKQTELRKLIKDLIDKDFPHVLNSQEFLIEHIDSYVVSVGRQQIHGGIAEMGIKIIEKFTDKQEVKNKE